MIWLTAERIEAQPGNTSLALEDALRNLDVIHP